MQVFSLYFDLGWQHFLNWQSHDHILFILALCGIYTIVEWKKVLILIAFFTVGYSTTLALSALNIISVNATTINFMMPLSIFVLAISNMIKRTKGKTMLPKYLLALLFGTVHGIDFSNYFKNILDKNANTGLGLTAFNFGLEFGLIITIIGILLLSFILIWILKVRRRDWNFFLSSAITGISFMMLAAQLHAVL